MLMLILLSMVLSVVLIIVNSALAMKKEMSREKGTPFECGYDPKSSARIPFSLHFFLVAVIFLIFDVEITILMPMPMVMSSLSIKPWMMLSTVFIIILMLGTVHEWNEGSLDWSK